MLVDLDILSKKFKIMFQNLNNDMFLNVLENVIHFVEGSHNEETEFIPTAALLTGVNMPDHAAQFSALCKHIKKSITPHVACLYSQDCHNIKYCVENMMDQFINQDSDKEDEVILKKGLFPSQ